MAELTRPVHPLLSPIVVSPADPLADEDLQLALYLCYELHYRGLPGVADEWEWEPSLLALRRDLEACFEAALTRDRAAAAAHPLRPRRWTSRCARSPHAADAPSLSRYIERVATLEQVLEFLAHRSAYQLKEADPHSWALPRMYGGPKAALVQIQADEYGGGVADRIHAQALRRRDGRARPRRALRRVPRPPPGRDARDRQPHVAVRPAPSLARRDRRAPRAVRDGVLGAQPPLRERPAPPGLRRAGDGVLRRARHGRRDPRVRRRRRPRGRPRAPAARADARHPLGRGDARRARRPRRAAHARGVGARRELAARRAGAR